MPQEVTAVSAQVDRGVRPHALPFAVFDEFGRGADDRVQDFVATLVADNALLKATEQRLRRLLEGADRRAVANGKEFGELAARASDVAGERAANAALTDEVERLRAALLVAVRQNEHDMLMTGEELRACRAALAGLGPNVRAERPQTAAPQPE